MNKFIFTLLCIILCAGLSACSNKDAEEEAEILTRPIRTCDGLQADNGRAHVDGDSLHISATVIGSRSIATYRLHGPNKSLSDGPSVEVYELQGFYGQDFEEEEYVSQIDVQMALSEFTVPNEIIIKCREGDQPLIRILLGESNG